MGFSRLISRWAVVSGFFIVIGAGSPGSDCPPSSPAVGYHERCAGAVVPVLTVRPEEPAAGDSPVRKLMKLRHASALRRLAFEAQRVEGHQDAPEKLLPILKDVGESRHELYDDPSALLPALEAQLALARLIEEARESEVQVGRAGEHSLEDARYTRLDCEVRLARARAALKTARQDR
jgi:hypothetical protein